MRDVARQLLGVKWLLKKFDGIKVKHRRSTGTELFIYPARSNKIRCSVSNDKLVCHWYHNDTGIIVTLTFHSL